MRLRLLSFILIVSISFLTCNQNSILTDRQEIFKLILNTVPSKIPLPPTPQLDNRELSKENEPADYIDYTYAINSKYFIIDDDIGFSTKFWKTKDSENRFGKTEIDSDAYKTLKGLLNFTKEEVIEKQITRNVFDENTLILNQQFIKNDNIKEYEFDGIISFSNISFNQDRTLAAIGLRSS